MPDLPRMPESPLPSRPSRRPPRRRRRRDLPAKVRRRQTGAVIVAVGAVGFGAYQLLFSGGGGGGVAEEVTIEKLIGQSVIGKVGKGGANEKLLRRVRQGAVGGVIVEPRNERSLRRDTAELQKAALAGQNPPLLVMVDQEGGPVKRIKSGPPKQSPAQIAKAGSADTARTEGEDTGAFLSGLGVNVDLAPVVDVANASTPETIRTRTFGTDPAQVAELSTAFAEGLETGGVAATAKHFPGLGLATGNTDNEAVTVGAPREEIEVDLEPFRSAVDAGVPMVMMATAVYPSLGSTDPAAWAEPIISRELREELGFDGVVITDDLESQAVKSELAPDRAALAALQAGVDLVLFALSEGASEQAYKSLVKAAGQGTLDRVALEDSYERIQSLKESLTAEGE